jgi:hypothetical protein
MPSNVGGVSYALNAATYRGEQAIGLSFAYRANTNNPFAVTGGVEVAVIIVAIALNVGFHRFCFENCLSRHDIIADVEQRAGNDRFVKRTSSFITTFRMQRLPNTEFGAAVLKAKVSRKALFENCLIAGHLR